MYLYIGRTGHPTRRHREHQRDTHEEQSYHTSYDTATQQLVQIPWESRAMRMHALHQEGLESKQSILCELPISAYVVEYEHRFILHAIQHHWGILNAQNTADVAQKVQNSSLDFLQAPFEALVQEKWVSATGLEAGIRHWYRS